MTNQTTQTGTFVITLEQSAEAEEQLVETEKQPGEEAELPAEEHANARTSQPED